MAELVGKNFSCGDNLAPLKQLKRASGVKEVNGRIFHQEPYIGDETERFVRGTAELEYKTPRLP